MGDSILSNTYLKENTMKISADQEKCVARVGRTLCNDFKFLVLSICYIIPVSMFVMIALFLIAINGCYDAYGENLCTVQL